MPSRRPQPANPSGETRPVAGDEVRAAARPLLTEGTRVRVVREPRSAPGDLGEGALGDGTLVDALAPGRPLRVALDDRPVLVSSAVRDVHATDAGSVQVVTAHSVYRLERLEGPPCETEIERLQQLAAAGRRAAADRGRRRRELGGVRSGADRETRLVALEELPALDPGPVATDTRLRVSRLRKIDPAGAGIEALGSGFVLDRVEPGAALRIAIADGPVLATTVVQDVRVGRTGAVEVETANTTYYVLEPDP